jgi:hypothetical protein
MKKISILLCFLCFLCDSSRAQSLKDIFFKMPQEVCPALSEYNRLELIDNQKNNKPMQTRNIFKTFSKMDALTDTYAHLIVSKNSEKTLKLLNSKDGAPIVMVISTVFADSIPDSSIAFYTAEWKPLEATRFVSAPTSKEFRRISINPETDELTITALQPLTLSFDDDAKQAEEPQPLTSTYRWSADETQFIQQN